MAYMREMLPHLEARVVWIFQQIVYKSVSVIAFPLRLLLTEIVNV